MRLRELAREADNVGLAPTSVQISEFERQIGRPLPKEYLDFLAACNGGHLGGTVWYVGADATSRPRRVGINHIGGLRDETHYSLSTINGLYRARRILPDGMIWIMDDPFGNGILLGLATAPLGGLYFWDHECAGEPPTRICNSLSEFIERCELDV